MNKDLVYQNCNHAQFNLIPAELPAAELLIRAGEAPLKFQIPILQNLKATATWLLYWCAMVESVTILNSIMIEVMYMKLMTRAKSPESVGCKCYRPGDPEFETIASQVTPLHKIRSEFFGKQTLYQEEKPDCNWRRNENINDLFAGGKFLTV